jgi:hypothetical protein
VRIPCDILQKQIINTGNWPTKCKRETVITLEVKFESNINGVIEEISDCGNVNTTKTQETLYAKLEELREGKLTKRNEESICTEKRQSPRARDTGINPHIKGTLGEISEYKLQKIKYCKLIQVGKEAGH